MGFQKVGITSNLGGPVGWLVGQVRFQEDNLQNLAWTFADAPPYAPTISYSLLQIVAMDHLSTMLLTENLVDSLCHMLLTSPVSTESHDLCTFPTLQGLVTSGLMILYHAGRIRIMTYFLCLLGGSTVSIPIPCIWH